MHAILCGYTYIFSNIHANICATHIAQFAIMNIDEIMGNSAPCHAERGEASAHVMHAAPPYGDASLHSA
jgi:hypothetical protein